MQDNAGGHVTRDILAFMAERGLVPILWPVFSLDLNPIETLWNRNIIEALPFRAGALLLKY